MNIKTEIETFSWIVLAVSITPSVSNNALFYENPIGNYSYLSYSLSPYPAKIRLIRLLNRGKWHKLPVSPTPSLAHCRFATVKVVPFSNINLYLIIDHEHKEFVCTKVINDLVQQANQRKTAVR